MYKKCPDCCESDIQEDAKVCKHCSYKFDEDILINYTMKRAMEARKYITGQVDKKECCYETTMQHIINNVKPHHICINESLKRNYIPPKHYGCLVVCIIAFITVLSIIVINN